MSAMLFRSLAVAVSLVFLVPAVLQFLVQVPGAADRDWRWWQNGLALAGGVAVPINPLMVPEEVAALLRTTSCRAVVCLDLLLPLRGAAFYAEKGIELLPVLAALRRKFTLAPDELARLLELAEEKEMENEAMGVTWKLDLEAQAEEFRLQRLGMQH